jgi:hypothetical protein
VLRRAGGGGGGGVADPPDPPLAAFTPALSMLLLTPGAVFTPALSILLLVPRGAAFAPAALAGGSLRPRRASLRRLVAFHTFLMLFSVRPGISFAIAAHLLPIFRCRLISSFSSSSVQHSRLNLHNIDRNPSR